MRFAQRQIFCELQETLNERNYVLPLIYGDQLSSENCFDYLTPFATLQVEFVNFINCSSSQ